jgi:TPR repeat protein
MSHTRWIPRLTILGLVFAAGLMPSALAAEEPKPVKYALLVGVKDYEHQKLLPLKYTENDVTELAAVLRAADYEVVLLTSSAGKKDANAKPTRANIDKQLKEVLAKCKKSDIVLAAFAGHGLQFDKVEDSFFCPEDAVPLNDEDSRKTLLSLKDIYQQLEKSPGAVKLLLVDACRNDPSPGRGADGPGAGKPPAGVAALFSCSAGERAYEHDHYRHGIFFYHVLEGLRGKAKNGDGDVTWDTLQAYVRQKVSADAPKLLYGVNQTPSLNAGELRGQPPVLMSRDAKFAARPTLAIQFIPLDRTVAEQLDLPQASQAQIYFVIPGGGGDLLGLRRGDVIRRLNGRAVETESQLLEALINLDLGERVQMEIIRDKKALTFQGSFETPISVEVSINRIRDQAMHGDAAAQTVYAHIFDTGDGVKQDLAEAAKWYRKAAEQGDAWAQNNLGVQYKHGQGVKKDDAAAVKWFRKAADQGYGVAQKNLGVMYEGGRGVNKDEAEAVKWYRKAADQRDSGGQVNLGVMYEDGRGVKKDEAEAASWYRKAAEQGDAVGQINLGFLYEEGRGVNKDEAEAAKWFRKAAEQGDGDGQYALGRVYEEGRGVKKDKAEAIHWYRKAAAQGSNTALLALKRLTAKP